MSTLAACPGCGLPTTPEASACGHCGHALGSDVLPVHTRLREGRYELTAVLGRGGFGVTYAARHLGLDRVCAIKELFPTGCRRSGQTVLPGDAGSFRLAREAFLAEGRELAKLRHPGVVRVDDAFEEHGTAYLVMELLDGATLEKRLAAGPLPADEVTRLGLSLCESLAVVHAAGLLHRDVKPANVFLTHQGRTVLIDFGSARGYLPGAETRHPVMVTPGYAPLEQYLEAGHFGPPTDVYALAATLTHALVGRAPAAAPERVQGHDAVVFPAAVPPRLAETLRAGLALKVSERPASATAFGARLEAGPLARAATDARAVEEERSRWAFIRIACLFAAAPIAIVAIVWQLMQPAAVQEPASRPESAARAPGEDRRLVLGRLLAKAVAEAAPGSTVHVPGEEHLITEPLRIDHDLVLAGAEGAKVIIENRPHALTAQLAGGVLSVYHVDFVARGDANQSVVRVAGGQFAFEHCSFTKGKGHGFHAAEGTEGSLRACKAIGRGGNGFQIEAARATLQDCEARFTAVGVAMLRVEGGAIERGRWVDNEVGIVVHSGSVRIARNELGKNALAIVYRGKAAGEATGNVFVDNGIGVEVLEQAAPTIKDNYLGTQGKKGALMAGVVFAGDARGVAQGNQIRTETGPAIVAAGRAAPVLIDNDLHSGTTGLAFLERARGEARNNKSRENGGDGVYVGPHAYPELRMNRFDANRGAGMRFARRSDRPDGTNTTSDNAGGAVVHGEDPSLVLITAEDAPSEE